jgi:two-component system LytT family response regulator
MSLSVYIVDDEKLARERLSLILNAYVPEGVTIVGDTDDEEEALEKIPELSPDLVFLDIEMPRTSGLELAEELKLRGYTGKIVFVTAYDHYAIKAIRAGAFDYLLKPVDVDELKLVLDRLNRKNGKGINSDLVKRFHLSSREMEIVELLLKGF